MDACRACVRIMGIAMIPNRFVVANPNNRSPGRLIWAALVGLLWVGLVVNHAFAEDDSELKKFKALAEMSVVNTSGNTDIFTLSLKNTLEYDFSHKYLGTWNVNILSREQNDEKSAERYGTDLRLDNFFSFGTYAYLLGSWLQDKFAGYDNRYSFGPGVGQKFVDGPAHYLKAEIGCNWTREDYSSAETESFLEGRASGRYEYLISEISKFSQKIEYLHDFEDPSNYKIETVTALTSALTKVLAIKIAYDVRYQNRPVPENLKKTDTIFSASLLVSY